MTIKDHIRDIPDFPSVGHVYRDISPLLHNIVAFEHACEMLYEKTADLKPDVIVGIESRGFLFAGPLAMKHGVGMATAKKRTSVHPLDVVGIDYSLEMGTDRIEMLKDAVEKGERVLMVDDLLATGITAKATTQLVEMLGGTVVGFAFLADINRYDGKELLEEIAPVIYIYDC
jgi:adenine phosphoribosyltransferase